MKKIWMPAVLTVVMGISCSKKNETAAPGPEIVISPGQSAIVVDRLALFTISPEIANMNNPTFEWVLQNEVIATTKDLNYYLPTPGNYTLVLKVADGQTRLSKEVKITVESKTYDPYISKVFDFLQAPGQLVNVTPAFVEGDTRESMIAKANEALTGSTSNIVSLGGYGGYIVFGFDHLVWNKSASGDFKVLGNALIDNAEPGIVEVSIDANANGLPDDKWYEIAGSEYESAGTIRDYRITYTRPDPLNDSISWTDNLGRQGKVFRNAYHNQASYFPLYFTDEELTFHGVLLANNAVNKGTTPAQSWLLPAYYMGYADNYPNADDKAALDIEWAVDERGEKANLPGIHFVRVYTGVNQDAGWIGETSTEISGAQDLNLD